MTRLEDRIWETLRDAGGAVSAEALASRFLGSGPAVVGGRVIEAVLARDRRFTRSDDGWTAVEVPQDPSPKLESCEWVALGGDLLPVGPGREPLLSVTRFRPGGPGEPDADTSCRTELFLLDSPRVPRGLAEDLRDRWGFPCTRVPELKVLRLLDDLLAGRGLFLRLYTSAPVGTFLSLAEATGTALPEHFHPLADVARIALPGGVRPKLEDVLTALHVEVRGETPLQTELRALPDLLPSLLEELMAAGLETLADVPARLADFCRPFDFTGRAFAGVDLEALPDSPGVYLLRDADDRVVYVGKSVNLRRRVSGYFRFLAEGDEKLERIQALTHRVGTIRHGSDLEASLEEARLIRELRPIVNTQLEVRPEPEPKPLAEPVVALLPHADEGRAAVFVLHPGGWVHRRSLERRAPDVLELERFLERACGDASAGAPLPGVDREGFPLALRWLRRNTHRVAFFKYHDHPDAPTAVRALLALLGDLPPAAPPEGG